MDQNIQLATISSNAPPPPPPPPNRHNKPAFYEGWNFNSGNYLFTTDTK